MYTLTLTSTYHIPQHDLMIHDKPSVTQEYESLDRHFNDLYKFFLRKLALFEAMPESNEDEQQKLKSLLEELFRVKNILHK